MTDALERAIARPVPAPQPRGRAGLWIALAATAGLMVLAVLVLVNKNQAPSAPPKAAMSLSRTAVIQGGTLVVSGANLPADQAGSVELQSRPVQIGSFTAGADGGFSVSVTVPDSTSKGDHVISVCWDSGCPLHQTLTVLEAPPSPSASAEPSPTPTPSATATSSPSPTPSP